MSAPKTLAALVHRDRQAMVSTMSTLAAIAETHKTAAAQYPRDLATEMMRRSIVCTQAATTIRDLLLASGVTEDDVMAIADELDRELDLLAVLDNDSEATP